MKQNTTETQQKVRLPIADILEIALNSDLIVPVGNSETTEYTTAQKHKSVQRYININLGRANSDLFYSVFENQAQLDNFGKMLIAQHIFEQTGEQLYSDSTEKKIALLLAKAEQLKAKRTAVKKS